MPVYCKSCKKDGIKKYASHGYKEDNKLINCGQCAKKIVGMINLKEKRYCIECGKEKDEKGDKKQVRANFGFIKDKKATYCETHKLNNMINIYKKTCIYDGCTTSPSFGYVEKEATHCKEHKYIDMKNVIEKLCKDCDTQAGYGYRYDMKKIYCSTHKKEGMEYLKKSKRCIVDNCKTPAVYGKNNEVIYCGKHKYLDVEVKDILKPICIYKFNNNKKCETRANYGNHIEKNIYCARHYDKKIHWKLKTCIYSKTCKETAIYSETGNYEYDYCEYHKPDNYKSYLEGKCKTCGFNFVLDEEGFCLISCTKKYRERIKFSENEMNKFFELNNFIYIRDKQIDNSLSGSRPDFVFELKNGILIVENDEYQHKSRPCSCEQKRMIGIHNDIFSKKNIINVHFIRFNPDTYKTNKPESLSKRLIKLCDLIIDIVNTADFFDKNPKLSVRYMYYDNSDINKIEQINY